MRSRNLILGVFAAMALSGCLEPNQRVVNRAATGAVVGTVATAVVGGHLLTGAVVGGAIGALTSKDQHTWE